MTIIVTDHALDRWRERAAEYADAPADELRGAFASARPLADDEPLPPHLNRCGGVRLFRRDDLDVYFVTRWPTPQTAVILSVVRPGFGGVPTRAVRRPTADELLKERYDVESRARPKELTAADLFAELRQLRQRLAEVLNDLETADEPRRAILKQLRGKIRGRLGGIQDRLGRQKA